MTSTELEKEFAVDHRVLTRQLAQLLKAVKQGDLDQAQRLADVVDRESASHIQFEELVLYPRLTEILGQETVETFYREHQTVRSALRKLRDLGAAGATQAEVGQLLEQLQVALQHAEHCGTLASHLHALTEDERDAMLVRLREMRGITARWTELPGG